MVIYISINLTRVQKSEMIYLSLLIYLREPANVKHSF